MFLKPKVLSSVLILQRSPLPGPLSTWPTKGVPLALPPVLLMSAAWGPWTKVHVWGGSQNFYCYFHTHWTFKDLSKYQLFCYPFFWLPVPLHPPAMFFQRWPSLSISPLLRGACHTFEFSLPVALQPQAPDGLKKSLDYLAFFPWFLLTWEEHSLATFPILCESRTLKTLFKEQILCYITKLMLILLSNFLNSLFPLNNKKFKAKNTLGIVLVVCHMFWAFSFSLF